MIGDTLSVTHNGVAVVLDKINQDNFGSEYLKRTSTEEFRVRVRHQNETARPGTKPIERHNVELTRVEFDALNGDRTFQAYCVIRAPKSTDPVVAERVGNALISTLTAALVTKVVGWQV
jgi:hypothetical protein